VTRRLVAAGIGRRGRTPVPAEPLPPQPDEIAELVNVLVDVDKSTLTNTAIGILTAGYRKREVTR